MFTSVGTLVRACLLNKKYRLTRHAKIYVIIWNNFKWVKFYIFYFYRLKQGKQRDFFSFKKWSILNYLALLVNFLVVKKFSFPEMIKTFRNNSKLIIYLKKNLLIIV